MKNVIARKSSDFRGKRHNRRSVPIGDESHARFVRDISLSLNMTDTFTGIEFMSSAKL